jgi:branched-chain amino acid transport system ATP-binding protein
VTALLEMADIRAGYAEFEALHGVSLQVAEGETVAVMGANGAGKSTLLKVICGLVRPRSGSVRYDGHDLAKSGAHRRVAEGIALVPEGRRLFPSLTARENLLVGAYRRRPGPWTLAKVVELFPMLADRLERPGGRLSGGEQQAVAIGRALMANPRLLLMDEVSLGLAPIAINQLYAGLPRIQEAGATVLVVEQDVGRALSVADRAVCLLTGTISLEGVPSELDREHVRRAYFGM